MTELEVLLDARGATTDEVVAAAETLLASVPRLELVRADAGQASELTRRFGRRVGVLEVRGAAPRQDVPVLVVPGRAALARGAVRRILAQVRVPGRCLVCVVVPGTDVDVRVACWAPGFLAGYTGTLEALLDADLAFDRAHLPAGSPVARTWLRADTVGVTAAADVVRGATRWSRATGLRLDRAAAVASLRAPLGAARRRLARRRQRREQVRRVAVLE